MAALNPLAGCRRLVVKIGSALLVDAETGKLRGDWLSGLAEDIAAFRAKGVEVIAVSSGSIALGRRVLGLPAGALTLEQSQAAASVGQIRLARAYEEGLAVHDIAAGQVLVTLEDSEDRRRYLNGRATLSTLLSLGVVPIVNENDTVATDEIRFGDNDRLAAQVAAMAGADVLVLLSDVDGFYTANPKTTADAERLAVIDRITPAIEAMAGDPVSGLSKGGMKTKLMAAKTATGAGAAMAIADGLVRNPLAALAAGGGSWFMPQTDPQAARKRWIAGMKTRGQITIDAGAVSALGQGKSLLAAGVIAVEGRFSRGDPVAISGPGGENVAKGLIAYDAAETRAIMGRHSREIGTILGYPGRAALVHRDDMVT